MRLPAPAPLAATFARLAAIEPWFGAQLGAPDGQGWNRFDDVTVNYRLAEWLDELAERHQGRRDVAGSYLGSWLAGAAIIAPTAALVLESRLPEPFGPMWIHRHPDGWFDRVAFERSHVLVIDGDDAIGNPDARLVDRSDLVDAFASGLVARLTPVFDAVRALAPFGRRGLWGGVADELASAALWSARAGSADADIAWETAASVAAAVSTRTSWLRTGPRRFPVTCTGGEALFPVRGVCCLYYKTQPDPPEPSGDSYCTTCPFRDDASRHDRLVAHLQGDPRVK